MKIKIDEEKANIKIYNFGQLKSKGKPMPYQKYPQNIICININ